MEPRNPETEPGWKALYDTYLSFLGRKAEYDDLYRQSELEYREIDPRTRRKAIWKQMGLTDEIVLSSWRERQQNQREEEAIEEQKQKLLQQEFEAVFKELPCDADRSTVLAWIENHPAMVLARSVNGDGLVELRVEDIRDAPSRSAVGELQHWVNQKDKFYADMLKRKPAEAIDDSDGPSVDDLELHDPTLKDVKKMLDEIGC